MSCCRCDGKTECWDDSDEADCSAIKFSVGYNKFLTPPPENRDENLRINISIKIVDILNIDEVAEAFTTRVSIQREWFDSRLTYRNLKTNQALNALDADDRAAIWYPSVVYWNTAHDENIKATGHKQHEVWSLRRNLNYSYYHGDSSDSHNVHLFDGAFNHQRLRKQYNIEWICDFDMAWYPFDTQTCTMEMYCFNSFTKIHPNAILYDGPMELTQYFVRSYKICPRIVNERQGLAVVVILGRPLMTSILTIFIPTAFLVMISQVSQVFEDNHKDMVVMVSLTVILVQASL